MNMIIMPFLIPTREDKCPSCDKSESIKKVCAHCGYTYKNTSSDSLGKRWWFFLWVLGGILWGWFFLAGALALGRPDLFDKVMLSFVGGVIGFVLALALPSLWRFLVSLFRR